MKDCTINCLCILAIAALWAFFILVVFSSCNSSKHLQTSSILQDSTVKMGKDCTALSTSRDESRETNEKITRMLFGLQETIDAKGNPITNIYPKEYVTIDRGSKEQVSDKKDSIHDADTSKVQVKKLQEELDLLKNTQVFPMWWLWAIGGTGLMLGFATRFIKIQIR